MHLEELLAHYNCSINVLGDCETRGEVIHAICKVSHAVFPPSSLNCDYLPMWKFFEKMFNMCIISTLCTLI